MRAMPQSYCEGDARLEAQRCDRVRDVTLRALGCPEGRNRWEWQAFGVGQIFFATGITTSLQSLRHQEAVCRNAQRRVVVETPPASSFIVTQSQVLLQSPGNRARCANACAQH